MGWFRTRAGGENHDLDINTDCVEYVRYEKTGDDNVGFRMDAVLYMRNGKAFRIDPVVWETVRGPLVPVPERTG